MIWICSLFLLIVAAWLFFNALNERRWVEAHSHDETVASDEGLLSAFTLRTGTGPQSPDGKISIDQENSRFARAVRKVQEKTSGYGEKFFESKVAEARSVDPAQGSPSASEENTLFGRAVSVVAEKTARMEENFKDKVQQGLGSRAAGTDNDSLFERTKTQVAATTDELSQRVASGAKSLAGNFSGAGGELYSNARGKLSSELQKFERKPARNTETSRQADTDILSRVAKKVGDKIEQVESRVTKKVGDKMDQVDSKLIKTPKSDSE